MNTQCFPRQNSMMMCLMVCLAAVFSFGYSVDSHARGKPQPPSEPPATYPPARAWHAFTGNGGAVRDSSRLYLLGGAGSDGAALADFWYYKVDSAEWTLAPTGSARPGPRQHAGLSCGVGQCVTVNGNNGISLLSETWVYTEATARWSKVNCKKQTCPAPSDMVAIAYDGARFQHVLFGGLDRDDVTVGTTYVFAGGRWSRPTPDDSPSPRHSAAMTFVPAPVNKVVLFGGLGESVQTLCDLWAWTGSNWQEISTDGIGPCLYRHSMIWDGNQLVIAAGYVDIYDTPDSPNSSLWSFEFDSENSGWWSNLGDPVNCSGEIRPGSRMAFDQPSGSRVYFGGEENIPGGFVRYADTAVCN